MYVDITKLIQHNASRYKAMSDRNNKLLTTKHAQNLAKKRE